MKAFVITIKGHAYSESCAKRCIESANIPVEVFDAVKPEEAKEILAIHGLLWTYGNGCHITGLKHPHYGGGLARIACSMSHYLLWQKCVDLDEPILILEHDAVFVRPFEEFEFRNICMINDPEGATKRGKWWSCSMKIRGPGVHDKTKVLDDDIPDGLAGNSAYVIKPHAAQWLIDTYKRLGVWPNDATMCRQLFDLQELFPFMTRVEQTQSTTCA